MIRTRRGRAGVVALLAFLTSALACQGDDGGATTTTSSASTTTTATTTSPSGTADACDDAPIPPPDQPGFTKTSSSVKAAGTPAHGLADALAVDGAPAAIAGRFQYGRLNVDLDEERIEVWLDDCSPSARLVGTAVTDADGIIELEIPDVGLDAGRYAVHAVVAGDGTAASAVLTVVPPASELTVFDIDGTLTIGDSELLRDVLSELFPRLAEGDYVPEARSGAPEATRMAADAGRVVVYLTGRPVWLAELSRDWLVQHAMAPGILLMPARDAGAAPNERGVGATKLALLQSFAAAGLDVVDAYGNADTDAYAYRAAGIPDEQIHMLGPVAPPGVDALGEDFQAHNASR